MADEPRISFMPWSDIARASEAWRVAGGAPGSPYDEFRGRFLPLPGWFDAKLDPLSAAYLAQQDRLWAAMAGVEEPYRPTRDELTSDRHIDPVVKAGLYSAPFAAAGEHLIALGHIVRHCGLVPGDRVLEYGAGFGQIAVALARLGASVDTVDIDHVFCESIAKQASFFRIPLRPHEAEFGFNPGGTYKLILFYEAFHHARLFSALVPRLRQMLAPGGKIMMAGEPINPATDYYWVHGSCPYPWGIRLEAEVAAIVRFRKWYELGFRQEFIANFFTDNGFKYTYRPGLISHYADIHEFSM